MSSALVRTVASPGRHVGVLLRTWRQQRRRSQLDLALDVEISQRRRKPSKLKDHG